MKAKLNHQSQALLRYLLGGLKQAKIKWQIRYNTAVNEEMRQNAQLQVNHYSEEIKAYKKMLREGTRV